MPSTTTERTASCRARSLPLSSMALSTPPPVPGADGGTGAAMTSAATTSAAPMVPADVQPVREAVDRDHLGAAESRQPRGEQPDHTLPEDRHAVAEPDVGGEHGVQRDRAHPGERASDGLLAVPHSSSDGRGGHDGVAAMPPDAVHHVAHGRPTPTPTSSATSTTCPTSE